jgi:hypothetical protein
MVRAKFRVLGINYRLSYTVVELKPVIAKSESWPDGSEENRKFWSASPSGESELVYKAGVEIPYQLGDYVYIDMTPGEDGRPWKLWEVSHSESQLGVSFGLGHDTTQDLTHASLKIDIENEGAWESFQGKQGSKWVVAYTKVEGVHPDCPYTSH